MASTASAAVAASMLMPFHCVICFDEFDLKDRVPMVLPCGHTYVCSSCTKRLRRCMECRQPLYTIKETAAPAAVTPTQSRAPVSYGGRPRTRTMPASPPRKPRPVETTPLPIPRNVVMIAMMEAAGSQMALERRGQDEVDENAEAERILSGIEAMSGACGTFAVKEEHGLAVLPYDPRKRVCGSDSTSHGDGEPFHVVKGQTLQIVQVQDGVYKIARDGGYVVASESQLVKVGGPMETSCRLEGMMHLVETRKLELDKKLKLMESIAADLSAKVRKAQEEEPSHPVISDPPLSQGPEEVPASLSDSDEDFEALSPIRPDRAVSISPRCQFPRDFAFATSPIGQHPEVELMDTVMETSAADSPTVNLAPRTPNTIDNSDIAGEYADENVFPGMDGAPYMCTAFSLFASSSEEEDGRRYLLHRSFEEPPQSIVRPRISSPHQRISSPGIATSPSMGSIDFSTGLSGHRALFSNKTGRGQSHPHRNVRMMGEHRGIGTSFWGPLWKSQSHESSPQSHPSR